MIEMTKIPQPEIEAYHAGYKAGYEVGKRDAVRHGEWERVDSITEDGYKWSKWVCSNCGYIRTCGWEYTKEGSKPTALLCEHCGARMNGKEGGE